MNATNKLLEDIKRIFVWLVISLMILILDYIGWITPLKSGLEFSLGKTDRFAGSIVKTFKTPYTMYVSWQSASKRIASLEDRLSQLAATQGSLESLENENHELKESIGQFVQPKDTQSMIATLIPTSMGLRINKGSRDGIIQGLVVTSPSGGLIGHIDKVGAYTSQIKALADAGAVVSVRIVGRSTGGIAVGDGFRVQMSEVLQTEILEVGDIVISTGTDGIYPEGIVLGQITELLGDPSDITKAGIIDIFAQSNTKALVLLPK